MSRSRSGAYRALGNSLAAPSATCATGYTSGRSAAFSSAACDCNTLTQHSKQFTYCQQYTERNASFVVFVSAPLSKLASCRTYAVYLAHARRHELHVLDALLIDELCVRGELSIHALGRLLERRRRQHRGHVPYEQDGLHPERGLAAAEQRERRLQRLARQALERREERHRDVQTREQEPRHVRVRELPEQVQRVPQKALHERLHLSPARLLMRLELSRLVRVIRARLPEQPVEDGVRLFQRERHERVKRRRRRELHAELLVRVLVAVVRRGSVRAQEVSRRPEGRAVHRAVAQFRNRRGRERPAARDVALCISLSVLRPADASGFVLLVVLVLGRVVLFRVLLLVLVLVVGIGLRVGLVEVQKLLVLFLEKLVKLRVLLLERLEILLVLRDVALQRNVALLHARERGVRVVVGVGFVLLLFVLLLVLVVVLVALGPLLVVAAVFRVDLGIVLAAVLAAIALVVVLVAVLAAVAVLARARALLPRRGRGGRGVGLVLAPAALARVAVLERARREAHLLRASPLRGRLSRLPPRDLIREVLALELLRLFTLLRPHGARAR
eukprot:30911-Pelagococcus_subviridis.AAC.9